MQFAAQPDLTTTLSDLPDSHLTIIIGANGSGKSSILRKAGQTAGQRGKQVLAICPSLFDRFDRMGTSRVMYFGARKGLSGVTSLLSKSILQAQEDPVILRNISHVLRYTGFNQTIGVRIIGADRSRLNIAQNYKLSEDDISRLKAAFDLSSRNAYKALEFRMDEYSFKELHQLSFAFILKHLEVLKKIGAIKRVEFILYRYGQPIPLLKACSGELWFILCLSFIATNIRSAGLILIDEPETSLHPTWQKDYIKTLLDLFHYYNCRIVIATHSPIIVSGAEAADGRAIVFQAEAGNLEKFQYTNLGLEEMYDRLFGIITPKNHHLSNLAVALLNDLNLGHKSLQNVQEQFSALKERSYDATQISAINAFTEIAANLDKSRRHSK